MELSRKQFDVLVALEGAKRAMSQRDIAEKIGASLGTVQKQVIWALFQRRNSAYMVRINL